MVSSGILALLSVYHKCIPRRDHFIFRLRAPERMWGDLGLVHFQLRRNRAVPPKPGFVTLLTYRPGIFSKQQVISHKSVLIPLQAGWHLLLDKVFHDGLVGFSLPSDRAR